jgi:hypothetical protein
MAKRTRESHYPLIGCPDCSGVPMADVEGNKGHTRYVCQVGHRVLDAQSARSEGTPTGGSTLVIGLAAQTPPTDL